MDSTDGVELHQQETAVIGNAAESLSPEEKEKQQQEWRDELAKTEEEVNTLKQVLVSKQRRVQELRKSLGITVVANISKDMKDGLSRLSESEVVQKANMALKTAGERTSAAFSNVGKKLEDVKSKSLFAIKGEAKVGAGKSAPTSPTEEASPFAGEQNAS